MLGSPPKGCAGQGQPLNLFFGGKCGEGRERGGSSRVQTVPRRGLVVPAAAAAALLFGMSGREAALSCRFCLGKAGRLAGSPPSAGHDGVPAHLEVLALPADLCVQARPAGRPGSTPHPHPPETPRGSLLPAGD